MTTPRPCSGCPSAPPGSSASCWPSCSPRPPSRWPGRSASSGSARRSSSGCSAEFVPALNRHAVLIPACGLVGALVVIGADAVVRAMFGAEAGIAIPTGVVTTIAGAVVLVLLARRLRDAGPTRQPPAAGRRLAQPPALRGRARRVRGAGRRHPAARPARRPHLAAHRRHRALAVRAGAAAGPVRPGRAGPPGGGRDGRRRGDRAGRHAHPGDVPQSAGRTRPARHHRRRGARRGDRGDRRRDGHRGCVEHGHPDGRDDRRAGRLRPGLRADLARRAERRPAGAGRHRRLVRRDRPHHAAAGPGQPVGHAPDLHLAVRHHLRPQLGADRAGRRRAGPRRAAGLRGPAGARPAGPGRGHARGWSASTWNGCG